MTRPNLFSFATSELSQDAFICWLLSWASQEYKESNSNLHQCAIALIASLFKKHGISEPSEISDIKITKQDKNIDVLCIINNEFAILIEDKTGTKQHSNQLQKYYENVKGRGFSKERILPIYFKSEDQGNYSAVLENGYKLFLRKDILKILGNYKGGNSILLDYKNYLQSISDRVDSYQNSPISEWKWHSWIGFYIRLQAELGTGNWDYVHNPSGGFLGMWWHFQGDENCEQYIQLEEEKLCIKIWVDKAEDRKVLREKWYRIFVNSGKEKKLSLTKPARFGSGKFMTVCIFSGEYRQIDENGIINIKNTVTLLQKAESILKSVTGDQ